ncbi:MAG: 6-phosphogluconolactonase [Gammaproteobacteria bacterium]
MPENSESNTVKLKLRVFPDADSAAGQAASFIAMFTRHAVNQRGRVVLAVSGGVTPKPMFKYLAVSQDISWTGVQILQTDERVAPAGDADRNLTLLQDSLLAPERLPPQQLHAMPVEMQDLDAAARQYAGVLESLSGTPPVLDLAHLGLGADGHTASLVPGDPVLQIMDRDVVLTNSYHGRRRMTLTYPVINRARCILWLVTGAAKADILARLCNGDTGIPAGRINRERAVVFADQAAAVFLTASAQ